jgi:acyl-CoA thioesterase-1
MRIPDRPHGPQYAADFAAIYPRLAAARRLHFVPFLLDGVAGVRELNFRDGLHPTAAGQVRLAANVLRPVELALAEVGSSP